MGYRSEVAYVIVFETVDKRDTFIELMRAKNDEYINTALKEVKALIGDSAITFYEYQVKWYDGYPEVGAHDQLMRNARDLFDAATRFIRIGEETDDMEELVDDDPDWSVGEVDELMDIYRSIDIKF